MLQAFVVVFREGFEAFLIVAIIAAYLRKTRQDPLLPAVKWGVVASVFLSALLGYALLQGANEPLWEGIFGLVAAVLVGWLVIQMWRVAPRFKKEVENHLVEATEGQTRKAALAGVFLFTTLMIAREGMEMALLLIQIRDPKIIFGILSGIAAALGMAVAWIRWSQFINLKLFFQVTSIFLLLFVAQILLYSFHEFTEVGWLPYSEVLHQATEPFSPSGLYGKWFSLLTVLVSLVWLFIGWLMSRFSRSPNHA